MTTSTHWERIRELRALAAERGVSLHGLDHVGDERNEISLLAARLDLHELIVFDMELSLEEIIETTALLRGSG